MIPNSQKNKRAPTISTKYLQEGGKQYQSSKYRSKLANPSAQEIRAVYMAEYLRDEIPESAERILEFGAGFGQNLLNLDLIFKVAYEPAEYAIANAVRSEDIQFVDNLDAFQPDFFDVVLSFHSLEHTVEPYQELLRIRNILKHGGLFILIVPVEKNQNYRPDDPNHHLYSWTKQSIGNLLTEAGFKINHFRSVFRAGDLRLFFLTRLSTKLWFRTTSIYGRLLGFEEILIVGKKPGSGN